MNHAQKITAGGAADVDAEVFVAEHDGIISDAPAWMRWSWRAILCDSVVPTGLSRRFDLVYPGLKSWAILGASLWDG